MERRWGATIGLAVATGVLLSVRLDAPGWFDNEGRFAEAAREMALLGDWVTPRVDFFPLLTKPPLTQWLGALVFLVTGPSEWARVVPIAAAMVTLVVTCRLGARLYGERVGLVAGVMLATTFGFVLEARTFRPDCLVIAAVVSSIFAWHVAETGAPARRTRWLVAMYAVLGLGALAKGLVPVAVAGAPIAFMTLRTHGVTAGIRRLRPLLGVAVFVAVAAPWHLAAAWANPGFAWDYVVNQHLLFAFDRKEPRDSEGDTLAFFWAAFAGRSAPWSLLLPFTAGEALARLRLRPSTPDATVLLWAWCAGLLGVFSLTPSRLEHYSLPAMPAVALLGARAWDRLRVRPLGAGAVCYFGAIGLALVATGLVGLARGREALAAGAYWLPQAPGLMALVVPASLVACTAGLLVLVAALRRGATALVAALALGVAPFLGVLIRALIEAEALFSWRPVARALERLPPATEIVFEAPVEYQVVGGLVFYVGRPITMLEPRGGYTPPTYLEGGLRGMFIGRDELDRRWHSGRPVAIVSDPQSRRDTAEGLVPPPYHVLDRFGDRWVLTNFPIASSTAPGAR